MKFLIVENCKEARDCPFTQGKGGLRLVEASTLEEAKEKALDGENGYFPYSMDYTWDKIKINKRTHTLTVYEMGEEHPVKLQEYLDNCVEEQKEEKAKLEERRERELFLALKAKFESV